MYDETTIDNALVRQKDAILHHLSTDDAERYFQAIIALEFNQELWAVLGYGYKYREILERIKQQSWELSLSVSGRDNKRQWKNLYETAARLLEDDDL